MSKNIKDTMTYEDCLRFKAEHPELKRGEVLHGFHACYMAMKRLKCLDELYPSKAIVYPHEFTYEDCVKFKEEHPDMSRYDISAHYGKYYKAMKELGCIDELYPLSKGVYSSNLTYEDCVRFREEHPDLTRTDLYRDYTGYCRAMKKLNCLDELFPRLIEESFNTITYEDCVKFKEEHPILTRRDLSKDYARYAKAMKKFGCLDEFYPLQRSYAADLTREDCIRFREEHPDMTLTTLNKKYMVYSKAMRKFGLLDDLFPDRRMTHEMYSDEYLIAEARKYSNKKELREKAYWLERAIRSHKLQKKAYAHMEVLGNRKQRMIYAYEFPDHSVYVGLTFNYEKRGNDHKTEKSSAVRKYIKKTGLEPIRRKLTGYVPVKEAQILEGEFEEKYRKEGWKILNVAKTGGAGTTFNKAEYGKAIELWQQGLTCVQIGKQLGVDRSTIEYHLRHAGLLKGVKHFMTLTIEQVDDDGNILRVFESAKEAADYFKVKTTQIRTNIYNRHRLKGYYLRYNQEEYELKRGKPYGYSNEIKTPKGTPKPVCQYTIDGEFVRSYKNARETAAYGFNYRHVSQVCNGKEKTHKGFVFRFEKEI